MTVYHVPGTVGLCQLVYKHVLIAYHVPERQSPCTHRAYNPGENKQASKLSIISESYGARKKRRVLKQRPATEGRGKG